MSNGCGHAECCTYLLCAHPKCCGYALPSIGGKNTEGGALTGQAPFSSRARAQSEHEVHTVDAHAVITAELTACVLGARRRPELRTDMTGVVARALGTVRRFMRGLHAIAHKPPPPPSRLARLRAWWSEATAPIADLHHTDR